MNSSQSQPIQFSHFAHQIRPFYLLPITRTQVIILKRPLTNQIFPIIRMSRQIPIIRPYIKTYQQYQVIMRNLQQKCDFKHQKETILQKSKQNDQKKTKNNNNPQLSRNNSKQSTKQSSSDQSSNIEKLDQPKTPSQDSGNDKEINQPQIDNTETKKPIQYIQRFQICKNQNPEDKILSKIRFQLNLLTANNVREVTRTIHKYLLTCHFPLVELDSNGEVKGDVQESNIDYQKIQDTTCDILLEKVFFDSNKKKLQTFLQYYSDFVMFSKQISTSFVKRLKNQQQEGNKHPYLSEKDIQIIINSQQFWEILVQKIEECSKNFKKVNKSQQGWHSMTEEKQMAHSETRSECYVQLGRFVADLYLRQVISIHKLKEILGSAMSNLSKNWDKDWSVIHMNPEGFLEYLAVLVEIAGCKMEKDVKNYKIDPIQEQIRFGQAYECKQYEEIDCYQIFEMFEWISGKNEEEFVSKRLYWVINNVLFERNKNEDIRKMWPAQKYQWSTQLFQNF